MSTKSFSGGEKLEKFLKDLAKKLDKSGVLEVGFMGDATESKTGVQTAYVAYINEFGGTIPERTVPEHKVTIYRRVNKKGEFLTKSKNKFVKKSKANLVTEHIVPEHVIPEHKIPARPFFRNMIAAGESHWGQDLGKYLKQNDNNVEGALDILGQQLSEELQESIKAPGYAPLAKSTIKAKGFDQTLIDSSDMTNAVTFRIEIK